MPRSGPAAAPAVVDHDGVRQEADVQGRHGQRSGGGRRRRRATVGEIFLFFKIYKVNWKKYLQHFDKIFHHILRLEAF